MYLLWLFIILAIKFHVGCHFFSTSNELDEEDNVDRLRVKVIIETDLAIEWYVLSFAFKRLFLRCHFVGR